MKILAVISQKGGVGKTTIATSLAVAAELDGKRVAVFDLDPQASACFWGDKRKATKNGAETLPVRDVNYNRLQFALDSLRTAEAADLVVLDCPPQMREVAEKAIVQADVILIPSRPEVLDLRAMMDTVKLVKMMSKRPTIVLNCCPVSGSEVEQARQIIAKLDADLAPFEIHQRKAHSRAQLEGLTAQEIEPDGKAAAEVLQLYKFSCLQLYGEQNGKIKGQSRRHA